MREPRRFVKAQLRTTGRNKAACDEAATAEIVYFFTPTENTIIDFQDLRLVDSDYQRSDADLYWTGTYIYEWTERE